MAVSHSHRLSIAIERAARANWSYMVADVTVIQSARTRGGESRRKQAKVNAERLSDYGDRVAV